MVIFTGPLTGQSLVSAINRANVVILPSLFPEPYPLVVLEAMACAKPIVGFKMGGVKELLEDNTTGFLIPPKDPAAMADRILYLLDHPREALKMGKRGRKLAEEKFPTDVWVENILSLYCDVLAKGRFNSEPTSLPSGKV